MIFIYPVTKEYLSVNISFCQSKFFIKRKFVCISQYGTRFLYRYCTLVARKTFRSVEHPAKLFFFYFDPILIFYHKNRTILLCFCTKPRILYVSTGLWNVSFIRDNQWEWFLSFTEFSTTMMQLAYQPQIFFVLFRFFAMRGKKSPPMFCLDNKIVDASCTIPRSMIFTSNSYERTAFLVRFWLNFYGPGSDSNFHADDIYKIYKIVTLHTTV